MIYDIVTELLRKWKKVMKTPEQIQLPGLRQLVSAFLGLVLLLLAFDSALQWLSFNLHQQPLIAAELLFPINWLSVLF